MRNREYLGMEFNVNRPLLEADPSAKSLIEAIQENAGSLELQEAVVYHNFPLYRDVDDSSSRAHVLVTSPRHGVLIFECSSLAQCSSTSPELQQLAERLDQVCSQVVARLIRSKRLRSGPQTLALNLSSYIYLPNAAELPDVIDSFEHITPFSTASNLKRSLADIPEEMAIRDERLIETVAVLEGSDRIISPRSRQLDPDAGATRGKKLREIEVALANFDRDQKSAALNILDGPQRIRGLAGSGKTIVLTWKAALLHLQNPDSLVVYTYYTKSLYSLIKNLITRFYRHYAEHDPDWERLRVLHAWGGKNLPGVYSTICSLHGQQPIKYSEARGHGENEFDYVCRQLLNTRLDELFDYSILDEGQDFPPSFYRLCWQTTVNGRVIWGYDECQNILNVDIQDPRETFGRGDDSEYLVDLDRAEPGVRNDIVLHRCYRNPREILHYAFALGLGLYNERILQMPENNEHWEDLGFRVVAGDSQPGDEMTVERPEENTPLVMNRLFGNSDVLRVQVFDSVEEEIAAVVDLIKQDLASELLPEDILVVSLDDRWGRRYFEAITASLAQDEILTFSLLEAPYNTRIFVREGHITLSTVYRAKGNESGSVYVIGVDAPFSQKDSIVERNKLFTAMTRSKGWLTMTGYGDDATAFENEYLRVKADFPQLRFAMPDRTTLKTFQRDLGEQQAQLNLFERELEAHARKMGLTPEELLEKLEKQTRRRKNGK